MAGVDTGINHIGIFIDYNGEVKNGAATQQHKLRRLHWGKSISNRALNTVRSCWLAAKAFRSGLAVQRLIELLNSKQAL